ncbi:SMP-30/gluconolactonase/LRE family protein [Chondromyces crocatus]|uniref:SMP-30/Gluconolactonase/LRE-like region domain-containing protein n=1 Tax=Chondromyces crocatus TaxID=52 RepID=A0A0K1E912_CHOCO|nr:SMP-30/gluconolactonase/LRE family protein [Chondromyces crocatus]AKT37344.1 uncharacterized protein CMC5_014790 [Chondromyces crocatus]
MRGRAPLSTTLPPLAALSTVASLLATGCVSPETTATTCADVRVEQPILLLESDLRTTSGLGRIDGEGCMTETAGGLALSGDTTLSSSSRQLFVLDRSAGLVHRVTAETTQLDETFRAFDDTEGRANPQDVAVDAEGRLWVTRFDHPSVVVLDRRGAISARVDLEPYADADGNPEAAAIHIADGTAHVALEKLDAKATDAIYPPTGPGVVLAIPTRLDGAITPIELAGRNPFGRFVEALWDPKLLAIATPGDFGELTAGDGIDLIDTAEGKARQIISEVALGGSATDVALVGPNEAYALVAGPEDGVNPTRVVAFDPERGEVTRVLAKAEGYYHWGLLIVGDLLVVGDRTPGRARVVFFDRSTGSEAGEIIAQRLSPVSFALLP